MKATIENFNAVRFETIIITDENNIYKDTLYKNYDLDQYTIMGLAEEYDIEDLFKYNWIKETDNILNGDKLVIYNNLDIEKLKKNILGTFRLNKPIDKKALDIIFKKYFG